MENDIKLRTTLVIEYYVTGETVADVRCNRLTPEERAEWVAWLVGNALFRDLVSVVTERVKPATPVPDAPCFPCPHGERVGLCGRCNSD